MTTNAAKPISIPLILKPTKPVRATKIDHQTTDEQILREIGARLTALRLEHNLTQAGLAAQASVSKRTIERLEGGVVAAQLSGFLRVCRALGLMERIDAFIPEPAVSPIAQLKMRGKVRQRASGKRALTRDVLREESKWTWGDEKP